MLYSSGQIPRVRFAHEHANPINQESDNQNIDCIGKPDCLYIAESIFKQCSKGFHLLIPVSCEIAAYSNAVSAKYYYNGMAGKVQVFYLPARCRIIPLSAANVKSTWQPMLPESSYKLVLILPYSAHSPAG